MTETHALAPDHTFVVSPEDEGTRLDKFLVLHLPQLGRKLAARLCEERAVQVDARVAKKGLELHQGQEVAIWGRDWGYARPEPNLPLLIVAECKDWVIVEKPAGMPSGALVGRETGTLAGVLLARYPEMQSVGYSPREPGLLHRLDNNTSGLVLAAKNQTAFCALRNELQAGRLTKRYLALTPTGTLEEQGERHSRIAPSRQHPARVVETEEPSGHAAHTLYEVRTRGEDFDLIELTVHAAYRHQIRCHMAALQAPLVGDKLYGGPCDRLSTRHALHASYIAGAAEGLTPFEAKSPLPDDLRGLLEAPR